MMNKSTHANRPEVSVTADIDQAVFEWLLLLESEEDNLDVQMKFASWLNMDPSHKEAYQKALAIWESIGDMKDIGELEQPKHLARSSFIEKLRNVAQYFDVNFMTLGRRKIAAVSVFLVMLFGGLNYIYFQETNLDKLLYQTGIGGVESYQLVDDSVIIAAPNSKIEVSFSDKNRKAWVLSGEAFFEVAKDSARPFVIYTDLAEVRVVGTRFNVNRGPSETEVMVEEGEVEVSAIGKGGDARQVLQLVGGNVGRASEDGELELVSETLPGEVATWRKGVLSYHNVALERLVADVNRYVNYQVQIKDQSIIDIPVTAVFPASESEEMLFSLEEILPIRLFWASEQLLVLAEKS